MPRKTAPKINPIQSINIMLSFFVGLVIGAFIGWNVPQPPWAKRWSDKARNKF